MTDRLLGLFSGFPNGFPWYVADRLREELTERSSLVMIASEITKHAKVDRYAAQWRGWFEDIGLPFEAYHTVDTRMEPASAIRLVEEASCVILMGGDPDMQLRFLRETGLDEAIRNTRAAVLGLSAGAVNMAVRSLNIEESPEPYEGLGLIDITVHPHFDPKEKQTLSVLLRISETLPICAMEDDSAIFIKGERVSSMGEIQIIDRGMIILAGKEPPMNTYWSDYIQTSEELYRSRALRFHDGNKDLWLRALGAQGSTDILEVGCGGGIFCHRVKQYLPSARVVGLDFDTGHIEYAKQKSAELGLDCSFVNGDALALPFPDNSFDLCFSHTVMEHIPTAPFLAEQKRVLRPGGRIAVLSVRMKYSMPELIIGGESEEEQSLWKKMHAAAEGKCPRDNVGGFELSESDYPRALEAAGFRNVNVDFFNVTYYAPDNSTTPREMALEQINIGRLHSVACIEKSLRMAPEALTEAEHRQLLALMNARFEQRIAQYERGEKQWDLTARMVLCATGRK